MMIKKKVLAICGSTRANSSNQQIIKAIAKLAEADLEIEIYNGLERLPYFNPDLDNEHVSDVVTEFRNKITSSDGVLFYTPEYVFSLPGSLKNAIEWTVSTTVFSQKPVAIITASSLGEKTHESLQLILKTIDAKFDDESQLLISGVKTKVNNNAEIIDAKTLEKIKVLIEAFIKAMNNQ
ncbi:MAG: NADPH-dependent FMN reductase [Bacteroidia bacterium]